MHRKKLIWMVLSIIAACVVAGALICLAIFSMPSLPQQAPTPGLPTGEQSSLLESPCSEMLQNSSTAQETGSFDSSAVSQSQAEDVARRTGETAAQSAGQSVEKTQLAETLGESEAEDELINSCTIEIRCDAILGHMDQLKDGYAPFVPADGFFLHTTTVTFTPGETVLDVLRRVTEQNGLQLLESGGYVQSIGHLIEGCCGRSSGWMYTVNGEVPHYGCDQYQLNDSDRVSWQFVCDSADIITGG